MTSATSEHYPVNHHKAYHAHIYFDEQNVARVTEICDRISQRFGLKVGRIHQKLVGPHPRWSVQILFSHRDFDGFIPWLDAERGNLDVLVHGVTGDDYKDHTDHAYWLGQPVKLDLSQFEARS